MIQNRITVILGKKGKGKTTLLEKLVGNVSNTLIFDAMGAFVTMGKKAFESRFPGYVRVRTPDKLEAALLPWPQPLRQPNKDFRVVYSPQGGDFDGHLLAIASVLSRWYRRTRAHSNLVIDEVDIFNRGNASNPIIEEFVKRGRHLQLNQLYASRRPQEVPRLITSQADELFTLQLSEPRDLDYLRRMNFPEDVVSAVRTLDVGEYYRMDIQADKIFTNRKTS